MRHRIPLLTLLAACLAPAGAEVHEVYPNHHSRVFSAFKEPVAKIRSGDTVRTRTWDSGGRDHAGVWHIQHPYVYPESGNPLMGPFYVEGAEYGDALEVRLDRVRLNRKDGYTAFRLSPATIEPSDVERLFKNDYGMGAVRPGRGDLIPWDIDIERATVSPRLKPEHSSGWKLELPARPMLGCIGVAPPGEEVQRSGPSYSYGGNMDYNDVVEGATVYFPVYHTGAYLYVGDGHALQGDGEGLGNGVETSMDVEFTVRVHKGKRLAIPRLVNDRYLVSIASQPEFRSNMDIGLRSANSDMLRWLERECGLTGPEAHLLVGTVVEHKIVTYFGTIATLMDKRYLPPKCHQLWGGGAPR
jgi:amidase